MVKRLCADDPEAMDLIDRATAGRQGERTDLVSNRNEVESGHRPVGTMAQAAVRRLRKDRPDLHAAVLAGTKSPHGAMVEAGFRRKTIGVPLDLATINAILEERKSAEARASDPAAIRPARRPTSEEVNNRSHRTVIDRGETADYLTARIARDRPDIPRGEGPNRCSDTTPIPTAVALAGMAAAGPPPGD